MFDVVGATGNTGSAVADTLLKRKQPVRIVVRSAEKGAVWKTKGAEIVVASLDDVPALTKAFQGAEGLYLLVPPNYSASAWLIEQRARMDGAAEAVKNGELGSGARGGQGPGGLADLHCPDGEDSDDRHRRHWANRC